MGESVAPCFEYCATMAIFTVGGKGVMGQIDFPLRSREPFDRVRLLRDQQVDAIICGGVQDHYEDALRASGIKVISWVSGSVDDLLGLFLLIHCLIMHGNTFVNIFNAIMLGH